MSQSCLNVIPKLSQQGMDACITDISHYRTNGDGVFFSTENAKVWIILVFWPIFVVVAFYALFGVVFTGLDYAVANQK